MILGKYEKFSVASLVSSLTTKYVEITHLTVLYCYFQIGEFACKNR